MSKVFGVLWKVLGVALGILLIVIGSGMRGVDSSDWPAVQARVESSEPQYYGDSNTSPTNYSVRYWYRVGREEYSGILTTDWDEYKQGDVITVYYDPETPGTSIETPGEIEGAGIYIILFGVFCIGYVGWSLFKSIRVKKQTSVTPAETTAPQG